MRADLEELASSCLEATSYAGAEMHRIADAVRTLEAYISERLEIQDQARYVDRLARSAGIALEHLDGALANVINYAGGHRGFAAQAGLWFNPPVTIELTEGKAHIANVNERLVELPFAFAALSRLTPPARVLDIGAAESTFSLAAASLGFAVTALDLHPIAYAHPNLNSVASRFEDWDPEPERFDAVCLISTIEHFGLGAYGDASISENADIAALRRVRKLLADDGFLVLTTPYGVREINELERVYDEESFRELLAGWKLVERRVVRRRNPVTWVATDADNDQVAHAGVIMVVAQPDSHK
ncbi:MAG TPA: class I SAM-dependent methyltransferase [Solirubrobacteraceae bacterium]|jgi:2-polyprenyl-3-methyl-5-hydroxy-6-metoxy-1,4-benzoquinol methylase|nr:class I SAM-dependent methyltransferase [Solirubrobacteraceae bacterium]